MVSVVALEQNQQEHQEQQHEQYTDICSASSSDISDCCNNLELQQSNFEHFNSSWADTLPAKQGLYDPEYEKDACGVGFIVHIKGAASHKILSDSRNVLCNMTHRGAVGSDAKDGDGA